MATEKEQPISEGKLYQHKKKKPGFYLKVEKVEDGSVHYSRTGLKALTDGRDIDGKLPVENFKMYWEPARY